ncbi:hypothetical protein ACE1SV_48310 [Streptomyces sennicomposti]
MSRQRLSNISSNYLTTHHTPILEHAYDIRAGVSDLHKRRPAPGTRTPGRALGRPRAARRRSRVRSSVRVSSACGNGRRHAA